jgi:hypothetical protein
MFQRPAGAMAKLLDGKVRALRRNVSSDVALALRDSLERIGVACRVVVEPQADDASSGESQRTRVEPRLAIAPRATPIAPETIRPLLWNPNAVGLWALLMSPIFSSILIAKNWLQLGNQKRATIARWWAAGWIALIAFTAIFPIWGPSVGLIGIVSAASLVTLVVWYYLVVGQQTSFVAKEYPSGYVHRGWLTPLIIGAACSLVFTPAFTITRAAAAKIGYAGLYEVVAPRTTARPHGNVPDHLAAPSPKGRSSTAFDDLIPAQRDSPSGSDRSALSPDRPSAAQPSASQPRPVSPPAFYKCRIGGTMLYSDQPCG